MQERICRGIALIKESNVFRLWAEPFSGSDMKRPELDVMLKFIKNPSVTIDYLIVRDIDRLTRGGAGDYQIIKAECEKYGVTLIDSYGLIQPQVNTLAHTGFEYKWSKFSPSGTAETIKAEEAKNEKTTILTRLIGTEILMTKEGWHIGRPDDGFKNEKIVIDGKRKPIEVPDPERAPYYIEMFRLRASGKYDDQEVVDKINAMGFKTREFNLWDKSHTKIIGKRGGIPLSIKQLQRVILKPIYCGYKCEKWTDYKPVKAKFDGLFSVELFNKANNGKVFIKENKSGNADILHNYSANGKVIKRRNKRNPLFPDKEFVLCPYCKKEMLASSPSGKSKKGFPAYHCARGHKHIGINKKTFEGNFENTIRGLNFDTGMLEALKIAIVDTYNTRKEQVAHCKEKVVDNVISIEQKQADIFEALKKTNSSLLRKKFEDEYEELEKEKIKAEEQEPQNGINQYDIKNFFNYAKYLMEHFEELLLNKENQPVRRRLIPLVFDELPTYDDILNGTPKICFIFGKNKELALASSLNVVHIRNSWNQLIIELNEWAVFRKQEMCAGNMA